VELLWSPELNLALARLPRWAEKVAWLDADGQNALRHDLDQLWAENNRATDGTTAVESEYLEVRAIKS